MENGVRKREWVKTAAIILLAVLLVLTFFSKTIMNASLPEVATQQVSSGAINARIRGQGTVEASEVYNVTIKQTRKVSSVLVKTGQEINVGDTLFVLEAEDSDELKQAETDLETLQQNYDKSLIEAGNTAAQENRDVQNARDDYNEALAIYRQYSTMDASQLATQKAASEAKLKELQTAKTTVDNQITKIKAEKEYTDAQAVVTEQDAIIKTQQAEKEKLLQTLTDVYSEVSNAEGIRKEIDNQKIGYVSELTQWDSIFLDLVEKCDKDYRIIDECFKGYVPGSPTPALLARIGSSKTSDSDYYSAYVALMECYYGALNGNGTRRGGLYTMQNELQVAVINDEIKKRRRRKVHQKLLFPIMSAPSNLWKSRARRLTRRSPINRRQWTNSPARLPQLKRSNLRKKTLKTLFSNRISAIRPPSTWSVQEGHRAQAGGGRKAPRECRRAGGQIQRFRHHRVHQRLCR